MSTMPSGLTDFTVHERRINLRLHRDEIRRLVAEAAAAAVGVSLDTPGVEFTVTFEDAVGATVFDAFSARVSITADLTVISKVALGSTAAT